MCQEPKQRALDQDTLPARFLVTIGDKFLYGLCDKALNPIEKLWRKLKQEVLSLHRCSDAWPELQEQVRTFLQGYDRAAPDLLRYVGLSLPN